MQRCIWLCSFVLFCVLTASSFPKDFTTRHSNDLCTAASAGDLSEVKRLLNDGNKIDTRNTSGKTPLHCAAQSKNLDLVRYLIQQGADVNAKARGDVTPLMLSVDMAFGQPDIALELIKAGAEVSVADINGDTALIIASTESTYEVLDSLLRKGANPNAKGLNGMTALHYAAMNGFCDRVALLLRYGADPTIRNGTGTSAIQLAQTTNPDKSVKERFEKTRRLLLVAVQTKSK